MSKPTDDQLNRAMAELCGWTEEDWPKTVTPDGRKTFGVPDYCTDRNMLPEILAAVENSADCFTWERFTRILSPCRATRRDLFSILKTDQREIVEAALLALGKYPRTDQ